MAVKVDDKTIFEPDATVRCGPSLPGDATLITDPVIIVEVASPSTQTVDALVKFTRYFNNASMMHDLIVLPTKKTSIHHQRIGNGQIVSRSYTTGRIEFVPPGIEIDIGEVLALAD